jgi:hypothetical protein
VRRGRIRRGGGRKRAVLRKGIMVSRGIRVVANVVNRNTIFFENSKS